MDNWNQVFSSPRVEDRESTLDAERTASMADEGGATAATVDLREQLWDAHCAACEKQARRRLVRTMLAVAAFAAITWVVLAARPRPTTA